MGPLMQSGFAGEIEPWQNGYAWKHCQGPTRSASMSKSWDWERPRKIQQHPTFKKERDRNDCLRLLVQVVLQSHQCHTQFSNKRLDLQLSGWDRFGDQFAHLFTGSSLGFEREIKHLDGHLVQVSVPRGVVVQPDEVLVIEGEGMPLDLIQWRELTCYHCST